MFDIVVRRDEGADCGSGQRMNDGQVSPSPLYFERLCVRRQSRVVSMRPATAYEVVSVSMAALDARANVTLGNAFRERPTRNSDTCAPPVRPT